MDGITWPMVAKSRGHHLNVHYLPLSYLSLLMWRDFAHDRRTKIWGCYVITSLNWTLIFVGCVFRLKSKNNPRKNTCVIEFGLRLQILLFKSEHDWHELCNALVAWIPRQAFQGFTSWGSFLELWYNASSEEDCLQGGVVGSLFFESQRPHECGTPCYNSMYSRFSWPKRRLYVHIIDYIIVSCMYMGFEFL
jgi:hypothetical protein